MNWFWIFEKIFKLVLICFSDNLGNVQAVRNVDLPDDLAATDVRLTYFIYRDGDLFISPSHLSDRDVYYTTNSEVISGSISGLSIYNLTEPVVIVFNPQQVQILLTHELYIRGFSKPLCQRFGKILLLQFVMELLIFRLIRVCVISVRYIKIYLLDKRCSV